MGERAYSGLWCYRVTMQTTNGARDTAALPDGQYVSVDDGHVYLMASDMGAVGRLVPNAVAIDRVGPGWVPGEGRRDD